MYSCTYIVWAGWLAGLAGCMGQLQWATAAAGWLAAG